MFLGILISFFADFIIHLRAIYRFCNCAVDGRYPFLGREHQYVNIYDLPSIFCDFQTWKSVGCDESIFFKFNSNY